MRENRLSGSEGGARFNPLLLPLSVAFHAFMNTRWSPRDRVPNASKITSLIGIPSSNLLPPGYTGFRPCNSVH
jgi:hypothetical protein